jgi:mRNA-degrading endonuclease RelE of RelBE toxin-antitoxin system
VTYRVEFHAAALAQLKGLPDEAFDALVKRTVELVDAPWDADALYVDEPQFRQTVFDEFGLMSFHVDEQNELIRIFDITWVA